MSFTRQGLYFRELEPSDLDLLRDHRNKNWQGYRDSTPIMTLHNQDVWYLTLGSGNMAFMVEAIEDMYRDIGLLRISQFDHQNRSVGLVGVDVFVGHNGKGYAAKILRAATEWLIHDLGYHRVKGECTADNIAMIKSLEKAGFTLEGRQRGYIWRNGKWNDFLQYSCLSEDLC